MAASDHHFVITVSSPSLVDGGVGGGACCKEGGHNCSTDFSCRHHQTCNIYCDRRQLSDPSDTYVVSAGCDGV